jgi:menaquinone-dependent protoporphyrinogen oxidase
MSILVAYSSKHGATREIAERIAENLREAGQDADARPVREAGDLGDYEGFVLGSAAPPNASPGAFSGESAPVDALLDCR